MRTLTGTAAAEYRNVAVDIVYLLEIDATDAEGSGTTLYYASRKYTLGAATYSDVFVPSGIKAGWTKLRERGGLAAVSSFGCTFNNLEQFVDLQDTYVLDNDVVRLYVIFVTGAESDSDKVLLAEGVIEEGGSDVRTWAIRCIDASIRDFREIPTQKVNLTQHPYAPLSEFGKVIPYTFGTFQGNPLTSGDPHVAAMRCLDLYSRTYTYGYFSGIAAAALFEEPADVIGPPSISFLQGVDQHGTDVMIGYVAARRIVNNQRLTYPAPIRPSSTNDVSTYRNAVDFLGTTYATILSGETLVLGWAGIRTLGKMFSLSLVMSPNGGNVGSFTYTVKYDAAVLATATVGAFTSVNLTSIIATYFSEAWSLEHLTIEITPSASTSVLMSYIYLGIGFYAIEEGSQAEVRRVFATGTGTESSTDIQNYVISGTADTLAENPVEQLALVLSGTDLYDRPQSEINTASFDTAHAARDGTYEFSFQLMETVTWDYWNRFCFESALHLFKDWEGKWKVIARDKDAPAQHYISQDWVMLRDAKNPNSEPDVRVTKTPTRSVLNEFIIRYAFNPMTGKYQKTKMRSGQYRYTGTCAIDATAGTLTDASATFSTGDFPVFVGEYVYVSGNYTVLVDAVDSDTQLSVSIVDSDQLETVAAATYYGGPSISAKCVRSYLRYKTVNALGGEFDPLTREGGWPSDFIYDDTTVDAVLDYLEDWFTQRKLVVELASFWNALDVEVGDVCYLQCPAIPNRRDAIQVGTLDGAINDSVTTITLDTTAYVRDGDYLGIGTEAVLVTAEPVAANENLTVTRGQVNTDAAAHTSGAVVYLLEQKWEVTGTKPDVPKSQLRIELTEMPRAVYRVGAAMASDADYDTSSIALRVGDSWATPDTELVGEQDDHSDYSYARS